jgi:hypothetical protein
VTDEWSYSASYTKAGKKYYWTINGSRSRWRVYGVEQTWDLGDAGSAERVELGPFDYLDDAMAAVEGKEAEDG